MCVWKRAYSYICVLFKRLMYASRRFSAWWACLCACEQAWRGNKICRIITRKRLGRRWKASYWFLKGPDSSSECFISSALFVLHIKDSIFSWILIAVKTADPPPAEGGHESCVNRLGDGKDVGCDPQQKALEPSNSRRSETQRCGDKPMNTLHRTSAQSAGAWDTHMCTS